MAKGLDPMWMMKRAAFFSFYSFSFKKENNNIHKVDGESMLLLLQFFFFVFDLAHKKKHMFTEITRRSCLSTPVRVLPPLHSAHPLLSRLALNELHRQDQRRMLEQAWE